MHVTVVYMFLEYICHGLIVCLNKLYVRNNEY